MSSKMDVSLRTRAWIRKNAGWIGIGPRELATVVGKLDLLGRAPGQAADDHRARLGSSLLLLDMENLEYCEVTLSASSCCRLPMVSVFSPLGSTLLCAKPGTTITLPAFNGPRFLVVKVTQPDATQVKQRG